MLKVIRNLDIPDLILHFGMPFAKNQYKDIRQLHIAQNTVTMVTNLEDKSKFTNAEVVDWERFQTVSMGIALYQCQILEMFLEHAGSYVANIRQAVTGNDWDRLQHVAHKLKGISAHLGVNNLPELSAHLENLGLEKRVDGAQSLLDQLDQVLAGVKAILEDLHSHL